MDIHPNDLVNELNQNLNDFEKRRDDEYSRLILEAFGLSVGDKVLLADWEDYEGIVWDVVRAEFGVDSRGRAYDCGVTILNQKSGEHIIVFEKSSVRAV